MRFSIITTVITCAILLTGCHTNISYLNKDRLDSKDGDSDVIALPKTRTSYEYGELLHDIQSIIAKQDIELADALYYWKSINSSVGAMIAIPEYDIYEPVLVSDSDNMQWLRTDIYGNYSYAGAVFLDFRCNFKDSPLKMIHGHNMLDDTMFSRIPEYIALDDCKNAPDITLYTESGELTYRVFSVISINSRDEALPIDNILTESQIDEMSREFLERSVVPGGEIESNDLLVLNTCWYGESGTEKDLHCIVVASRL